MFKREIQESNLCINLRKLAYNKQGEILQKQNAIYLRHEQTFYCEQIKETRLQCQHNL